MTAYNGAAVPFLTTLDAGDQTHTYFSGQIPVVGASAPSGGGPTISGFSPAEGSVLSRITPITFQVAAHPDVGSLRRVVVTANRGGEFVEELVHDGISFASSYTGGGNSRSVITNGYQFTILRLGGWRGASITLRIIAIDAFGNLAQKTVAEPQALYTWPVAGGMR